MLVMHGLDKTGNSLGIEYYVHYKIFANNNFCEFCEHTTFANNLVMKYFSYISYYTCAGL